MSRKKRQNFNLGKNKLVNLLRNGLRILFLIIFLHWALWFTSYANCVNYQEAIGEKSVKKEEEKELKKHDDKTKKYQQFTGWLNEKKEKNIAEIEEDILNQIEKKKGLEKDDKLRIWKNEKLPDLEKLHKEIEELEKKTNPTTAEKEDLDKKRKNYQDKLKEAKKATIENIQKQLEKNELNIAELDDNKSWGKKITHDPLKFFLVSPLNQASKALGLHNNLFLEIIFKLVIIEIILLVIFYSETIKLWENTEKMRNPYLSVEEKEQLSEESSPLVKYVFFNGFMIALFNFFLSFHPAFFDRTTSLFQAGGPGTQWYIWVGPLFFSLLLSNISSEFLRHGRLLNKEELKNHLAKSWVISLVIALIIMLFIWMVGMNSVGGYLLSCSAGLVKFLINTIRAKFFGHREYSPTGGETTTHPQEQYN